MAISFDHCAEGVPVCVAPDEPPAEPCPRTGIECVGQWAFSYANGCPEGCVHADLCKQAGD